MIWLLAAIIAVGASLLRGALSASGGGSMSTAAQLLALPKIKAFEGFSATPYADHSQQSIGYGSKYTAGLVPNPISREQAEALLVSLLRNINPDVSMPSVRRGSLGILTTWGSRLQFSRSRTISAPTSVVLLLGLKNTRPGISQEPKPPGWPITRQAVRYFLHWLLADKKSGISSREVTDGWKANIQRQSILFDLPEETQV
jgi:hypothetical protein